MSDQAPTQPTIETILAELRDFRASVEQQFSSVEKRLDIIESQLVQMDARSDRLEGVFHSARSEMLGLRADLKEFRAQFKEPA